MNLSTSNPLRAIVILAAILTAGGWTQTPVLANGTTAQRSDRQSSPNDEYYEEGEYNENDTLLRQQTTTGLTQQSNLIGACRYSPDRLDVFADAGRGERLLTIAPATPVTLTGVVGTSIAQIRYPADGWISSLTLEPCTDETNPEPEPEPEAACYRTLTNVTVRTNPSTNARPLGYIRTGGIAYPTVLPPNEATSGDGRTWIEIDDFLGSDGWIATTGANGVGSNVEGLPEEECERD